MTVKTIIASLFIAIFLFSCDSNQDSNVASIPKRISTPPRGGIGSTETNDATKDGNTTDVPLDGGLSILLVAGAAYGVRRFRNKVTKETI